MHSCVICGKKGHGHRHFGAQACRACSAFFRRSIAERKTYKCNNGNKCEIKEGLRHSCRACRLQKCYDNGMFIDGTFTFEKV